MKPNNALKLVAIRDTKDHKGNLRKVGEEWLIREAGSYLPDVDEKVVEMVKGEVLTDKQCLHLTANKDFIDVYGIQRVAGEEWLVTNQNSQVHIKDVNEKVLGLESAVTLSSREYCFVLNPRDTKNKRNYWGTRVLRKVTPK